MSVQEEIKAFIASQSEPKRSEIQALHKLVLRVSPKCKLWFFDATVDDKGKVATNPNIGYGAYTIKYATGKTREFFRVGISPNTTGISVYVMGLEDKKYLINTYGKTIGKASVTGYCIKFKTINDIKLDVLEAAIKYGLETV
jgi:hypothetical protein